jgi:UDP-glucose 4-epimerase
MNKEKILVTGGAGFIGSHLVDELIQQSHSVVVIDNLATGSKNNLNPKAQFYALDIQNPRVEEIFKKEKPTIVFHLAAQINARFSVKDPIFDAQVNILGSLNLLKASLANNVRKFIFSSSGGVMYGEAEEIPTSEDQLALPESPYGVAKLAFEKYLSYAFKTKKLDFVALRYANVYGPRQNAKGEAGVIAIFIEKALKNEPLIIYGDGTQTRDYIYIKDILKANLAAFKIDSKKWKVKERLINIGTSQETSVNKICELLEKVLNRSLQIKKEAPRSGDIQRSCLDISKAKNYLNWEPEENILEGIKKTVAWIKNTQY